MQTYMDITPSGSRQSSSPDVLLVTGVQAPFACGVGDYTAHVAQALEICGVRAAILTGQGASPRKGVFAQIANWNRTLETVLQVGRALKSLAPRIVHIQYPGNFGDANRALAGNLLPWLARALGHKVVLTLHEYGERRMRWKLRALPMTLAAHKIVSVTAADAALLRRLPGLDERVVHIPIGPNLLFDRIDAAPSTTFRLSYFGFLHPLKGVEELLEAFALACAQSSRPMHLKLHGHFYPDRNPHHAHLLALVDRLGLLSSVSFPGPVPDTSLEAAQAFAETDLGVLPFREGLSERRGSFLAFGWAGIPVLTSPGQWAPEWAKDNVCVYLATLDPQTWAQRLCQLANTPSHDLRQAGLLLREQCRSRHSWNTIATLHASLYRDLTS